MVRDRSQLGLNDWKQRLKLGEVNGGGGMKGGAAYKDVKTL